MYNNRKPGWINYLNLTTEFKEIVNKAWPEAACQWEEIENIAVYNQNKVLEAFKEEKVNEDDFRDSSGYGYFDTGREKLENVFSRVFQGNKALVRPHILSGTHALTVALFGLLRPGDKLLSLTGAPYDTLSNIIGADNNNHATSGKGTLTEWGIKYGELPVDNSGYPDPEKAAACFQEQVKVAFIQKSPGYSSHRCTLDIKQVKELIEVVRRCSPRTTVLVDNCYGEFVEKAEPAEAGADVVAGSLIKNPGGGLAPNGGYIVGESSCVDLIAARYSAPGLEESVGSMTDKRLYFMGLFQAPALVAAATKSAVWAASLFKEMGFRVDPDPRDKRGDLVQKIELDCPERVKYFIKEIQQNSPVDSFVVPEPSPMPGYRDPVIMGAGTFIQGASSELSCDAPVRPPYTAFLQGGLTLQHGLIAVTKAAEKLYFHTRGQQFPG